MKKTKIEIVIIEILILFLILIFIPTLFYNREVFAVIGEPNATVTSELTIGASAPFAQIIDIEGGTITLTPNATTTVNCSAELVDYDGDTDLDTVSAEFFDNTNSFLGDSDDNNDHYSNSSCFINTSYGDIYTAWVWCLFDVWYYANPGTWNCSLTFNDSYGYVTNDSNTTQIQELLAVALPDTINFGTVNATSVSNENSTNVTNVGNVNLNLSLSGYARTPGDNLAMNCTQGSTKTIPIYYEQYNLTDSNTSTLNFSQFDSIYVNLTSNVVTRNFNLNYRQNDSDTHAANATYWRIYVPLGVGGTCNGTVIFGATQTAGS
jgi:hypothetical protein